MASRGIDKVRAILSAAGSVVSIPADARVRRTYAGRHQKAAGCWAWYVYSDSEGSVDIGSQQPLSALRVGNVIVSRDSSGDTHLDASAP